ncbi:hypothetical protein [Cognaticolwellia beringensis]|uniref:hypothetical protein n=1 Tax=Cognaticolwellia beringensis TaxID=1967665 RepID=UPI0012F8A1AC|nr:hypothetical protein [Cognaticolwellia beringensis]
MLYHRYIGVKIRLRGLKLTILIALFSIVNHSAFANELYVCSAYNSGPFIIDEKNRVGLVYTFTDFLNKQAQGKYSFEVLILPRARLLIELRLSNHCIVPFVSYKWFDPNKQLFYWSQPIIKDANVILSSQKNKLESISKERVAGMKTSQVIGFFDDQVEALISENTVIAFNTSSLEKSVGMVARKRIDFIVSGKIPLQYLIHKQHIQDQVYLSKYKTISFDRSVFVPISKPALSAFIEEQVGLFKTSVEWQQAKTEFGIDDN